MKRDKKKLNATLECHVTGFYALSHEASPFIYVLIWLTWKLLNVAGFVRNSSMKHNVFSG